MTAVQITELRAMLAAAAPAPWRACVCHRCGLARTSPDGEPVFTTRVDGEPERPHDAALIVALRNAAPVLLDELEVARARIAELEERESTVRAGECEACAALCDGAHRLANDRAVAAETEGDDEVAGQESTGAETACALAAVIRARGSKEGER